MIKNDNRYEASALAPKPASLSYTIKASIVLPPDTNHHGTIFGGKLMAYIDDVATIAATRHARLPVVTASTDSVDFLHPVKKGDAVCLSAFVTWAHKTSMEVFVRVVTEDLLTGERKVCATSFLTFVALGEDGRPAEVSPVIPETIEEQRLHETAMERKQARRVRRQESKLFAEVLSPDFSLRKTKMELDGKRGSTPAAATKPQRRDAGAGRGKAEESRPSLPAVGQKESRENSAVSSTENNLLPKRMEAYANAWGSEW